MTTHEKTSQCEFSKHKSHKFIEWSNEVCNIIVNHSVRIIWNKNVKQKLLCVYMRYLLFYSEYVQQNMWFINDTWHRLTWSHILSANQFLMRLFSRTLYIEKLTWKTKKSWLKNKTYLEWPISDSVLTNLFSSRKLKYFWQME